jgi:hypothetical protein
LADEGADVAISYASSAAKAEAVVKELRKNGVRAEAFKADGPTRKQPPARDGVVERFGRWDILVSNAGLFVTGAVDDGRPAHSTASMVNVTGVIASIRGPPGAERLRASSRSAQPSQRASACQHGRLRRPKAPSSLHEAWRDSLHATSPSTWSAGAVDTDITRRQRVRRRPQRGDALGVMAGRRNAAGVAF